MNYTWHLYSLNQFAAVNSPAKSFSGDTPPTAPTILQALGVSSSDNPTLTRVLDNYWVLSFATPALGSPETGNNAICVYACVGTPTP